MPPLVAVVQAVLPVPLAVVQVVLPVPELPLPLVQLLEFQQLLVRQALAQVPLQPLAQGQEQEPRKPLTVYLRRNRLQDSAAPAFVFLLEMISYRLQVVFINFGVFQPFTIGKVHNNQPPLSRLFGLEKILL